MKDGNCQISCCLPDGKQFCVPLYTEPSCDTDHSRGNEATVPAGFVPISIGVVANSAQDGEIGCAITNGQSELVRQLMI